MAHRIFISYAKKDTKALAEKLYEALNAHPDLSAWMDMSLEADSSWAMQIQDEIEQADYVVVLLSPDVNRRISATQRRSFVLNEIDYAQQENKPILPVMAQQTKQPVQIAGIQYIDLTRQPEDLTPVVERICQRFGVQTPAQLREIDAEQQARREREAEEKRLREAAVQDSNRREHESFELGQEKAVRFERGRSPQYAFAFVVGLTLLLTLGISVMSLAGSGEKDLITPTGTPIVTGGNTGDVSPTASPTSSATFTPTASPTSSATFTPTASPSATATNTATAIASGDTRSGSRFLTDTPAPGIAYNRDWTPVEDNFGGIPMVLVPEGCFEMGGNGIGGIHCFDEPFWISKYEVTNADFEHFLNARGYFNANHWTRVGWSYRLNLSWTEPTAWDEWNLNDPDKPVVGVSWYEAQAFASAAGAALCTEAQWEYAARGPDGLLYPWGNEFFEDNATYFLNAINGSSPVGRHLGGVSWVGALDMSGNAWEWTLSAYADYPYDESDGRENIEGHVQRVARGGAYNDDRFTLRTIYRGNFYANYRFNYLGFRLCRPVE